MKKVLSVISITALVAMLAGCTDSKERYIDLSTGKPVEIEKDEKTGIVLNKETKDPLYIYVDTKKDDTIYARTGKVINGHVIKKGNDKYVFDDDEKLEVNQNGAVEYKDGDYKIEVEKDGDIKIKNGDNKTKIDGETGERKKKKD